MRPNLVKLVIGDIYFFNFLMLHHWYLGLNGDMFWEPSLNRKKTLVQKNVTILMWPKKIPKKHLPNLVLKKNISHFGKILCNQNIAMWTLSSMVLKNQRTGFDQCWLVISKF